MADMDSTRATRETSEHMRATAAARAINAIREYSNVHDVDLQAAARAINARRPRLCAEVMDQIGSWPSSDPELAALQAVWSLWW